MALKRRYARLMVYTSNILIAVSKYSTFLLLVFWPTKLEIFFSLSKYWQVKGLHDSYGNPKITTTKKWEKKNLGMVQTKIIIIFH